MHESALARQILDIVLARARQDGTRRVRRVLGTVAETEALGAESLAFHFAAHARGTVAEGAQLELQLVHVEARCRACTRTHAPEHHVLLCPACGSADVQLLGETGVRIDSLEVD